MNFLNNFYYTFNCKFEEICKEFLDEILDKIYIIKYKTQSVLHSPPAGKKYKKKTEKLKPKKQNTFMNIFI